MLSTTANSRFQPNALHSNLNFEVKTVSMILCLDHPCVRHNLADSQLYSIHYWQVMTPNMIITAYLPGCKFPTC